MARPARPAKAPAPFHHASALLAWYDRARRDLPWRAAPGVRADPYRVWLAEIMLQQTQVAAVIPYYQRFLARWPRLADLAAAPEAEVMALWAGLGYYARARRLHACAKTVLDEHGGRFPDTEAGLLALPGIGAYTAAAIAAIAFGRPAVVVDGNVERVIARLFAVEEPLPQAKKRLRELAGELSPAERPGDYAQAVMDLGATVCVPRAPRCGDCPWAPPCRARALGIAERLPTPAPKPHRPHRHGAAFLVRRGDGAILLRRRQPSGLLGGMTEVPSTPWRDAPWKVAEVRAHAPLAASWRPLAREVEHGFTHFDLTLQVWVATVEGPPPAGAFWCPPADLPRQALPTLMRKVVRLAE